MYIVPFKEPKKKPLKARGHCCGDAALHRSHRQKPMWLALLGLLPYNPKGPKDPIMRYSVFG